MVMSVKSETLQVPSQGPHKPLIDVPKDFNSKMIRLQWESGGLSSVPSAILMLCDS